MEMPASGKQAIVQYMRSSALLPKLNLQTTGPPLEPYPWACCFLPTELTHECPVEQHWWPGCWWEWLAALRCSLNTAASLQCTSEDTPNPTTSAIPQPCRLPRNQQAWGRCSLAAGMRAAFGCCCTFYRALPPEQKPLLNPSPCSHPLGELSSDSNPSLTSSRWVSVLHWI